MNGNNPPDNSLQERTTEETQTLIQPIVRETTYTPILDPFIPQQQQVGFHKTIDDLSSSISYKLN